MARTRPAALLLALAAFLAACDQAGSPGAAAGPAPNGEASKSAGAIVNDARHALLAARSLHLTGRIAAAPTLSAMNVDLYVSAGAARGLVQVDSATDINVARKGAQLEVLTPSTFALISARAGLFASGRWVNLPVTGDLPPYLAAVRDLTDFGKVLALITPGSSTGGKKTTVSIGDPLVTATEVTLASKATLDVPVVGAPRATHLADPAGTSVTVAYDPDFSVVLPPKPLPLATVLSSPAPAASPTPLPSPSPSASQSPAPTASP